MWHKSGYWKKSIYVNYFPKTLSENCNYTIININIYFFNRMTYLKMKVKPAGIIFPLLANLDPITMAKITLATAKRN